MPIVVRCACGKEYHFKDEYAGRRAKCPACGQVVRIPGARPAGRPSPHSPLREDRRSRTRELALLGSAGFVVLVGIGLVVYFLFFSGPAPRTARPAAPSPATQQPSAPASEGPAPASGPSAPVKSQEADAAAPAVTPAKPPDEVAAIQPSATPAAGGAPSNFEAGKDIPKVEKSTTDQGAVAAMAIFQGEGQASLSKTEQARLDAFAATNKVSSEEGRFAYVRKLQEVVGHERAAQMEVRFYDSKGRVIWAWPHPEVDAVTFIKAIAENRADRYKGFLVHAGGAVMTHGTMNSNTEDEVGSSGVLIGGKRPDGSFYRIVRISEDTYDFDSLKDRLFFVHLLWMKDRMPQGYELHSMAFLRDGKKLCEDFHARFLGTYSEATVSQSGQTEHKERVPDLVWEADPSVNSEANPSNDGD